MARNQWGVHVHKVGWGPTEGSIPSCCVSDTPGLHILFPFASFLLLFHLYTLLVPVSSLIFLLPPPFFLPSQTKTGDHRISPRLSHIREMAFCLFARRKTETLPEELCKSFANCKTNHQRFAFPLLRKEYFKRDCQAEKPNIGKHILQLCY